MDEVAFLNNELHEGCSGSRRQKTTKQRIKTTVANTNENVGVTRKGLCFVVHQFSQEFNGNNRDWKRPSGASQGLGTGQKKKEKKNTASGTRVKLGKIKNQEAFLTEESGNGVGGVEKKIELASLRHGGWGCQEEDLIGFTAEHK